MNLAALNPFRRPKPSVWSKKIKIILAIILIIIVAAAVILLIINPFKKGKLSPKDLDVQMFLKGKPTATAKLGQKLNLGVLEITTFNKKEGSYQSLELDENYKRITKTYLQIEAKVFNPSQDRTVILSIGLTDNLGNYYSLDHSVPFYVSGLKDFGKNMTIWPRVMQEGNLFFLNVSEKAKEFKLIFADTETKEKVAFKFNK